MLAATIEPVRYGHVPVVEASIHARAESHDIESAQGPELLCHLRCHLQHVTQHCLPIGDRLPRAWRYPAADEPMPPGT